MLDPTLKNKLADIITTFTSNDLTRTSLELCPSHLVLLPILLVVSLPNGITNELIRLWNVVACRGDARLAWHLISHNWNISNIHLHLRLHHHWLLLLHHHRLLLWHHHRLLLLHHHRLLLHHHRLLLHHHWLLLHHHLLLLHLRLRSRRLFRRRCLG